MITTYLITLILILTGTTILFAFFLLCSMMVCFAKNMKTTTEFQYDNKHLKFKCFTLFILFGWYFIILIIHIISKMPIFIRITSLHPTYLIFTLIFIISFFIIVCRTIRNSYQFTKERLYNNKNNEYSKREILDSWLEDHQKIIKTLIQLTFWVFIPCTIFAILFRYIAKHSILEVALTWFTMASLITALFTVWISNIKSTDEEILYSQKKTMNPIVEINFINKDIIRISKSRTENNTYEK